MVPRKWKACSLENLIHANSKLWFGLKNAGGLLEYRKGLSGYKKEWKQGKTRKRCLGMKISSRQSRKFKLSRVSCWFYWASICALCHNWVLHLNPQVLWTEVNQVMEKEGEWACPGHSGLTVDFCHQDQALNTSYTLVHSFPVRIQKGGSRGGAAKHMGVKRSYWAGDGDGEMTQ